MKKSIYIWLAAAALAFNACSDDYLNTTSDDTDKKTIFESTENVKLAVNGLSRLMSTQYLSSQGFNGEGTIITWYANYPGNDFQKCNLTGWSPIINAEYHEISTAIYDYYPWFYYYKIIGNANTIICEVDNATGSAADKQFLKAQALTFRAYCYLMLSQLYSHRWQDSNNGASRGLPLRIDESKGDLPASTLAETYARIYKDLDEAIAGYTASGQDRNSKENYAVNIDVAYAIYARAALTREDWENAAKYAALARKKYKLMTNKEYVDGGFNAPNREWIWSVYSNAQETLYFYQFFAYQGSNSNASAGRNYPCAISKELYDQIPATDVRKAIFLDPGNLPFNTATGLADKALTKKAKADYGSKLNVKSQIFAYMQFKMQAVVNPGVGEFCLFRAAEMYLTEAEADCHLGKEAEAQALLVALNKTSGRDPSYTCTKTGNDLLTEVKLYRRFDLWGEGFDWFDFKRWKQPIVRKTFAKGGSFHETFAKTIKPEEANAWTWVIPNRETDYNSAIKSNTK